MLVLKQVVDKGEEVERLGHKRRPAFLEVAKALQYHLSLKVQIELLSQIETLLLLGERNSIHDVHHSFEVEGKEGRVFQSVGLN